MVICDYGIYIFEKNIGKVIYITIYLKKV
ncbi:MAG: hypothetical protein ACTH2I_11370 [Staphylococcus equorum]|nr:hypothetical protein [Staphylococcus equorum]MCM3073681.1 hypothetical protein [Staphylococcus equorum]